MSSNQLRHSFWKPTNQKRVDSLGGQPKRLKVTLHSGHYLNVLAPNGKKMAPTLRSNSGLHTTSDTNQQMTSHLAIFIFIIQSMFQIKAKLRGCIYGQYE